MSTKAAGRVLLAGTAAIASITVVQAQTTASGTAAGTPIVNTAQASYTVNGTAQTANSNTATFVVDRKVNLTVVADPATNTSVNLGQSGAVTAFRVTNSTNGTQDFLLSADQTFLTGIFTGDNFDVTNLRIFVDGNGDGVYQPGTDTLTYIDELAADTSRVVFIVGDVPDQQNAALAGVTLNVQAAAGGATGTQGAALVANLLAGTDAAVDVVFADTDSDGAGPDLPFNGQARASLAYEITTRNVALTVTKSSSVVTDGVSVTFAKALPGATVQYCLVVANGTALVPATGVNLTDVIPANTTYVPGSITVGGLAVGDACVLNGVTMNDDGTAVTLSPYRGSYTPATRTVTAIIPTLPGLGSVAASFRVKIN